MLNLQIGTKLMLTLLFDDDKEHPNTVLTSAFEEDIDDDILLIHAPFFGDILYPIPVGTECMLSYHDASASYSFEAVVLERTFKGEINFLKIKRITEVERTQRREDFRLKIILDCKIDQAYIDDNNQRKIRRLPCSTVDISGGGAAVRLKFKPETGEVIVCHLPIGENDAMLSFPAEVCWAYPINNPDISWKYNCGIKFIFKNKLDKENLVKIVFALQMQQRKRERGK